MILRLISILSRYNFTSRLCSPTILSPRLGRASGRGTDTHIQLDMIFRIHDHSSSLAFSDFSIEETYLGGEEVGFFTLVLLVVVSGF